MTKPYYQNDKAIIYHGDCLDVLPQMEDSSIDAVITDPPYPHIERDYGTWTTKEWWELIVEGVVPQVRRILKPAGSAVFILQPNSEKVGKIRGWLWEFMAWVCREWNMVQDVWWWNTTALPLAGSNVLGTLRPSIKACVWCGPANCYRNQDRVLWTVSADHAKRIYEDRIRISDSGITTDAQRLRRAHLSRGGVTPFNILPIGNANDARGGGYGHSATTPMPVANWWTRYIVPPNGVVLDPFAGTFTMGVAALQNGASFIGIEKEAKYCAVSKKRLSQPIAVKMI